MAGHSKWKQIKHRKEGADAKKGALYSKLGRLITVAARDGGTNPETNFRLNQAIEQARAGGLPKDNIERAIARAEKGSDAAGLKEVEYEAYGPGGSAFLMSGLTDNANRTTAAVKSILDDNGGRLATAGSVAYLFDRKTVFEFQKDAGREIELDLIDAGADDTEVDDDIVRALVAPQSSEQFSTKAKEKGLTSIRSFLARIPKTQTALSEKDHASAEKLAEALGDQDEINDVWTNIA